MPYRYRGVKQVIERVARGRAALREELGEAMYEEFGLELTETKRRVPVRYGDLRDTGRVVGPEYDKKRVRVALAYGDENVDYAWYVHEDLEAFHKVGEAKFLENPLKESAPFMADRIAARIDLNRAFS